MDLEIEILRESSKNQIDKIVRYVGNDPKRFRILMVLFDNGLHPIAHRAAWPVTGKCITTLQH